jgi:hypothetical protein
MLPGSSIIFTGGTYERKKNQEKEILEKGRDSNNRQNTLLTKGYSGWPSKTERKTNKITNKMNKILPSAWGFFESI